MKILKWNKSDSIFPSHLSGEYKSMAHCDVYYVDGQGFVVLNHRPKYQLYQRMNIPEIQDLFVLPTCRGQGVAKMLIKYCEDMVAQGMIGISVPVSPDFGVAQQLYFKLGYIPDGNGVSYDREPLKSGQMVRLDDNLCLMMIKDLGGQDAE